MRKILKPLAMLLLFSTVTLLAVAQEEKVSTSINPKFICDKGYWVIESNIRTPKTSVIHFYNDNNTLVYQEKVEGVRLNLKRNKTLLRLKTALKESLIAWETSQMKTNDHLVKNILKRK